MKFIHASNLVGCVAGILFYFLEKIQNHIWNLDLGFNLFFSVIKVVKTLTYTCFFIMSCSALWFPCGTLYLLILPDAFISPTQSLIYHCVCAGGTL